MRSVPLALAAIAALVLGACSAENPKPKPTTRLAAKVNGEEIALERFELLRARAEAQPGHKPDPALLMDSLIDQVLFAQRATKGSLDQRGFVQAAIEEAKAGILARAYLDNQTGQPPSASEVSAFYEENARLFEERRVFRVFEIAVVAPAEQREALGARAAKAKHLTEIAEWLERQRLPFMVGGSTMGSEQLASPLLATLRAMKKGEIRVMPTSGGASVLQLVQSEAAPLSREQAAPMIESLLRARWRQEVLERETKHLRGAATIEYRLRFDTASATAPEAQ